MSDLIDDALRRIPLKMTSSQRVIPGLWPRLTSPRLRKRKSKSFPGKLSNVTTKLLPVEWGSDNGHDADDDSGNDGEPLVQDISSTKNQETQGNIEDKPEYKIISTGGQLVQVPVDSEVYQSAAGILDPNFSQAHAPPVPAALRVEEVMESLSESEQNEAKSFPIDEFLDYLTSAQSTTYSTDMEGTTAGELNSPITISSHRDSHIFIAQRVNLALCRDDAVSTALRFCLERVSVTSTAQAFCVIEPCTGHRSLGCRHIVLQLEDRDVVPTGQLPCSIQLATFRVGETCASAPDDNSTYRADSVASFSGRCRNLTRGVCRRHTIFDEDGRAGCALPVELFASPQITTDEFDAGTERASSEAEVKVDGTHHDPEEQPNHHDGFPPNPSSDDDISAFTLLKTIVSSDDLYEPPYQIGFDQLIRFLSLIDKYSQHLGDKPRNQAKAWAARMRPSKTVDRNALPWLWVMWKLRMEQEFKSLSSTIQREARVPILQWQTGPENKHGLQLPEAILSIYIKASYN